MPKSKPRGPIKLSSGRRFDARGVTLETCPYCENVRIAKTPRRKGGPSMFHCRKCGFMANIDQMLDMHRLLGHVAA